mmetsp:Transcript_13989/g.27776  ORF Transcript_13989/g.27776 Transcript_13989/m.27776 type:complete len:122 (-) Transcript_13989:327-692(-)
MTIIMASLPGPARHSQLDSEPEPDETDELERRVRTWNAAMMVVMAVLDSATFHAAARPPLHKPLASDKGPGALPVVVTSATIEHLPSISRLLSYSPSPAPTLSTHQCLLIQQRCPLSSDEA